ncbi:MAG: DUF542 domain-containing protein [Candidatus Pseudobacter hemicellulosilyticus]|uniref:DUF542 domain-containing protein n=1 Tax=Candidatus Pseudobacter hemicellulosilyticus TaxID=3121375 RepID=A0AAJ6BDP5_9BACT|nr:MAG: DUF542 domain-containing protein [Pseudobacter sp.]
MPQELFIDEQSYVTDIVTADYRTADVFRKYDIEFCCGGRWPLKTACEVRGLDLELITRELKSVTRVIQLSPQLQFAQWPLDFLADYIVNIHHAFIKELLPQVKDHLDRFAEGHRKKYPYLTELQSLFDRLLHNLRPHLQQEEEVIFPYIKQIHRAYMNNDSYASLLVRTLRKPVEALIDHEHATMGKALQQFRELTGHYKAPPNACISHRVTFSKLLEMDLDLTQHIHLENDVLFPRAIAIEKELLQRNGGL